MELAVGARRIDLTTGVVVIGTGRAAGLGADAVLEGCGSADGLPTAVRVAQASPQDADASRLVVLAHVGACRGDPVEEVRASLHDQAGVALGHGIAADRLVLDPGVDTKPIAQAVALLRGTATIADGHHTVAVAALGPMFSDPGARIGLLTLAISRGCRVVITDDTRTARRVADVVTAMLSAL